MNHYKLVNLHYIIFKYIPKVNKKEFIITLLFCNISLCNYQFPSFYLLKMYFSKLENLYQRCSLQMTSKQKGVFKKITTCRKFIYLQLFEKVTTQAKLKYKYFSIKIWGQRDQVIDILRERCLENWGIGIELRICYHSKNMI